MSFDVKQLTAEELKAYDNVKDKLADRYWRLNNLYYIVTDDGKKIRFKMNAAQDKLYKRMWWRNVILKARQLGMTTFVMILMTDAILFNSNVSCCVVAQGQREASDLFNKKIRFAYDNLPDWLKRLRPTVKLSESYIELSNNSSIIVSTSARSGTFQYLHISELAKICKKWPSKGKEIKTGSLPAARAGITFIESTAEGKNGLFYETCNTAQKLMLSAIRLTRKDFRFHFFPWWDEPANVLDEDDTVVTLITRRLAEYFFKLETKYGIELTANQKAWYAKEEAVQGEEMKQEHPSYPDEAFEQSIEGRYFGRQFISIYEENRITNVPVQKALPVDTWWDIGVSDSTVVWFTQTVGRAVHIVDFYMNTDEGLEHYLNVLTDKGYRYGKHTPPHDMKVREWGTGVSRYKTALKFGYKFEKAPESINKQEDIEAARVALNVCWFDAANCEKGIEALEQYTKSWNENMQCWSDTPRHDWASNPADAFQVLAKAHPMFAERRNQSRGKEVRKSARTRG